jgi:cell division septation protein DedD
VNETRAFEDQLPWLQPVEDEDEPRGVSARKMLAALLVVAMGAAIVAAAFFWLGQREAPVSGPPELIQALPGPYKVKPPNPGGLDISAESETAFETSAGEDRDAQLDTSKLPNRTAVKTPEQPKPEAAAEPAKPVAPEPAPAPAAKATGGTGSVIQLGAFANKAQAERAWTALSSRFPSIAALNKMIVPFEHGMRLRAGAASAADARQACDTLKAAGENCFVAQ